MEVVWNGSKHHPGGRQLFVPEEAPRPVPDARHGEANPFTGRSSHDTTLTSMGRRKHPVCETWGCSKRVDAPEDEYCRVCKGRA